MIVYLIHFARPLGHARHYIGTTRVYQARMRAHRAGRGAALLRACKAQGINWRVVRKWYGSRKLERQLKARKDSSSLCPVCKRRRSAYKKRIRRAKMASKNERNIITTTVCPTCKANAGKVCKTIRGTLRGQDTSIHPRRRALYNKVKQPNWPVVTDQSPSAARRLALNPVEKDG